MIEPAALPGSRLRAERERRGLSAQKAADEMHLDRWVIEALEADDYERVGPSVYAKGHLKKYAAMLGLPAAEIMAGYAMRAKESFDARAVAPSMLLNTRAEAPALGNVSPLQIAGALAALLLAAGVLWWKPWHQRGSAPASASSTTALPPAGAGADGPPADSHADSHVAGEREMLPDAAAPADAGTSATAGGSAASPLADAPLAGAGRARLRLSFSADSWVDVRDASGRRSFAGTGLANSVKTITGSAPMHVTLSFGSGVQLEINDRAVAIGPQFFAGDVARFEAGADGILRRESRSARPPG